MIRVRHAASRAIFEQQGHRSFQSFSVSGRLDPANMGFGPLLVLNEDELAPGMHCDTPQLRDMEVITFVVDGIVETDDSTGYRTVLPAGAVHRLEAGTGVRRRLRNVSDDAPARLLQAWFEPQVHGASPRSEAGLNPASGLSRRWVTVAVQDPKANAPEDEALGLGRDVHLVTTRLLDSVPRRYTVAAGRGGWLQVLSGQVRVDAVKQDGFGGAEMNGASLQAGDGAALGGPVTITIESPPGAVETEVLLFDMAMEGS